MTNQPIAGQEFARLGTRALVVLTLINMFNYIDRYVVPPLFESLRNDPVMGHPSDAQLGGLMTAFLVVYMLTSPLFGTLGDRTPRMGLIGFGVALWSLATAIGGLADRSSLSSRHGGGWRRRGRLRHDRPAVLADYFAPATRGRMMSVFYCAIPIGSALGYVLGGTVDTHSAGAQRSLWRAYRACCCAACLHRAGRAARAVGGAGPGEARPGAFEARLRPSGVSRARAQSHVRADLRRSAAYTFASAHRDLAPVVPGTHSRHLHARASSLPGAILVVTVSSGPLRAAGSATRGVRGIARPICGCPASPRWRDANRVARLRGSVARSCSGPRRSSRRFCSSRRPGQSRP